VGQRVGWLTKLISAVLVAAVCFAAQARADKRIALVVGNSAYKNVTPLDNPRNDARLMADTLRALGFTVVGGGAQLDLDKAQFDQAIQSFSDQIQNADVSLFYYAGHGVQVRGANYLVPVTANPTRESDVDFQLIDTALVLRQMEGAGTKLNIVILDACRNNPFGGRGLRGSEGGLAQMRAPEGTLISYATQPGSVARDGAGGNSPYTRALVETIRKPGQDIFQTFNAVGLAVKQATAGSQQPWVSSSPIAGDFYFAGQSAGAQSVAALPPAVAPPPVAASSASDEAARAWSVTQNTTSIAVIEDFIRQFGGTVYGSLARARLTELKKTQSAAVTPRQIQPDKSPLPSGKYDVVASGYASTFTITATGPTFSGTSQWTCCPGPRIDPIRGSVQNGKITFIRDCNGQGLAGECKQAYIGSIMEDGASGQWSGTGGGGSWTMHRR
jgi:caspase domain-containing protein